VVDLIRVELGWDVLGRSSRLPARSEQKESRASGIVHGPEEKSYVDPVLGVTSREPDLFRHSGSFRTRDRLGKP
jgi:hypothetical protein